MSSYEWFSAGIKYRWNDPEFEVFVRVWQPGDGLTCNAAAYNKRVACGAPVAIVRQVRIDGKAGKWDRTSITRVYCIRHLAKTFDDETAPPADLQVERNALEELAQRYWDQYQEIKGRLSKELLDRRFQVLPNGLREQVIAAASGDESESHGAAS